MNTEILEKKAAELMELINTADEELIGQIDATVKVPVWGAPYIVVLPASEWDAYLTHFQKVIAWAKLNDFVALFTAIENQPAITLSRGD